MNSRVLVAGWPFAGLLALDAGRAESLGAERVCGLVVEHDDQGGILVLESGDISGPLATAAGTGFYGIDGYPIARGDILAGDTVETVQEKSGSGWVATTVHVLRRAPRPGLRA